MKLLMPLLAGCLTILSVPVAIAQETPTSDEIVCKLDPHCPISKPGFRKLEITGGIPDDPLSVNLYVNFAYDSVELQSDARITLDRLGAALKDDRLTTFSFSIVGHTDAKGSDEYNQKLSERPRGGCRALSRGAFRYSAFATDVERMGKVQLLDPSHPEDGVNRRVQVLNVTALDLRK